ncbi:MAG: hypothetical protein ABIO78_01380 [Thermoanaerobaculia bacterium]
MNVDYDDFEQKVLDGSFRQGLEKQLTDGFRAIHESGERLPTASHYAAQIAEIVSRNSPRPISPELAFEMYQEILEACEHARDAVLNEEPS